MKKIVLFILLWSFTLAVSSQEWITDINQAKNIAKEKKQRIILVFQGSDWCAPCMKLDREIFSSTAFKTYSREHFIMLKADFPRKRKNKLSKAQQEKNNHLAEKYNNRGFFPLVVVLNEKGDVLGETGYKKIPPTEYIKLLNSF